MNRFVACPKSLVAAIVALGSLTAACASEDQASPVGSGVQDSTEGLGCFTGDWVPNLANRWDGAPRTIERVVGRHDGSPLVLDKPLRGSLDMTVVGEGDMAGNFAYVERRDYTVCGTHITLAPKARIVLGPEGWDAEFMKQCAADPWCEASAYCDRGTLVLDAEHDYAGTCQMKAGVKLKAVVYDEPCVAGGAYCGGDKLVGDPTVLYRCNAVGEPTVIERCANGCDTPFGEDDHCAKGK